MKGYYIKENSTYEWYCSQCGWVKIEREKDDLFGKNIKWEGTEKYKTLNIKGLKKS